MLVLSRKRQESVVIGGTEGQSFLCKVTLVEIKGKRVRLGIDVNRDIPVHRHEVWARIQLEEAGEPQMISN
jgi:carbon storage regulator